MVAHLRLVGSLAVLILCSAGSATWAQTPPPGAVPTPEQLRPRIEPGKADAPPVPDSPPVPRELGKPSEEVSLDVTAYAVDDSAPAELKAALPAMTKAFTGPKRSYEDLVNAAAAVTRFLQRELGFYLGYAYLPEQEPVNGVIRIAVLEGRLDQVVLNWDDKVPVQRSVVEAYLARLKPGEILRVRDVERIVFLVNDLRGITARFEVKSGRTPGTASLVVSPQPENRIAGRVEVDTHGSRFSGVNRISALATVASPLGRGDGLVVNALSSTTGGLQFGLLGYTLPVGSDGLKLGASLSLVKYKLSQKELDSALDLHGDANTLTVYGLYPVIRSRNLNLFSLVSLDVKKFKDFQSVVATTKDVTDLQFSASGDARDDLLTGGVSTYELSLIQGRQTSSLISQANANPRNYTLLRMNLTRLQNVVNNRLLIYGAAKAQFAFKNLVNTEQFQIGGPDRVRAFAPGEGTGDTGLVVSLELRYLPTEETFGRVARELVFSAFVDAGTIRKRHDPAAEIAAAPSDSPFVNARSLSGWGIGAIWDRPRDFSLRAYLAWPISGTAENDPRVKKPRIYATANKSF